MNKNKELLQELATTIEGLIQDCLELEKRYEKHLDAVHPNFQPSARNLIHYRAIRHHDLRDFQKKLGNLGISRLAKAEAHVMASLRINLAIIQAMLADEPLAIPSPRLTAKKSKRLHKRNAKALLGYRSHHRRARIMVTLPSEAADDYGLVHSMVASGMNAARINCAHDTPEVWEKMIVHLRKASRKLGRKVKVAMDLAGPKIRTGAVVPGPRIQKYRPAKDVRGRIPQPLQAWLGPEPHGELPHIPIDAKSMKALSEGDRLYLRDTRDKKRVIDLAESGEVGFLALLPKTTYLETNLPLYHDSSLKGAFVPVGPLPASEQYLNLQVGDELILHAAPTPGANAEYDENEKLLRPAHISCTSAEVFERIKPGEPVLFDDGKIAGKITKVSAGEAEIRISLTPNGGAKLRADKGINFPQSDLQICGLTEKDRQDLKFVAKHADVVNLSFVNSSNDVRELLRELEALNAQDKLGVILKIETQQGFNNLTHILLQAMHTYPIGIMIARGDLAIETGWENIGRIQEEILFLCRAAQIPDIWATQVLENLAKYGIPSRAEITDAAMAQRADCVMLNKGPHILQAIQLLDTILKNLALYQDKNAPLLPPMPKNCVELTKAMATSPED